VHGDRQAERGKGGVRAGVLRSAQTKPVKFALSSAEPSMLEKDWCKCAQPDAMLRFLQGKSSDRKFRLFICACCRLIWNLVPDSRSRRAVETAERLADGLADETECSMAYQAAEIASSEAENREHERIPGWCDYATTPPPTLESAISFAVTACQRCLYRPIDVANAELVRYAFSRFAASQHPEAPRFLENARFYDLSFKEIQRVEVEADAQHNATQSNVLRDIFGNPFGPVALDPRWLTSSVLDLARSIYDERAFERLPILADALMDAVCDNDDLLSHCRSEGTHVRGCWVVDLILGKE
jgi:hypothetical protein